MGFPGVKNVKNLPVMWENLGLILEEGMTTYFNILAWRIPMDRGAWQGVIYGVAKGQTRLRTASRLQHSKQVISEGSGCSSPGTEADQHLKGMR